MKKPRRDSGSTWWARPSTSDVSLVRTFIASSVYGDLWAGDLRGRWLRPFILPSIAIVRRIVNAGAGGFIPRGGSSLATALMTRASIGSMSVGNTAAI